jgi:hypothetical protein
MPDDRLEGLLADLGRAARAGDLAVLAAMPDRIEAALSRGLPQDTAGVGRIRDLALRNAALLDAALRGVRAARRRAADVQSAGRLSTYDARGRRDILGPAAAPPRRA